MEHTGCFDTQTAELQSLRAAAQRTLARSAVSLRRCVLRLTMALSVSVTSRLPLHQKHLLPLAPGRPGCGSDRLRLTPPPPRPPPCLSLENRWPMADSPCQRVPQCLYWLSLAREAGCRSDAADLSTNLAGTHKQSLELARCCDMPALAPASGAEKSGSLQTSDLSCGLTAGVRWADVGFPGRLSRACMEGQQAPEVASYSDARLYPPERAPQLPAHLRVLGQLTLHASPEQGPAPPYPVQQLSWAPPRPPTPPGKRALALRKQQCCSLPAQTAPCRCPGTLWDRQGASPAGTAKAASRGAVLCARRAAAELLHKH